MKFGFTVLATISIMLAVPAHATTYNVKFDGSFYDANLLVVTDASNLATNISGTQTGLQGGTVTGLLPASQSGNFGFYWDNLLSPTSTYLTSGGLLWTNSDTSIANLFYENGQFQLIGGNGSGGYYTFDSGTLTVSAVPLPGALPLFAAGLIGLAGLATGRRKSKLS